MYPHSLLVFFNQLCTLGFYVTFNVVKLMFIAFFVLLFHVCYHDGVNINTTDINTTIDC